MAERPDPQRGWEIINELQKTVSEDNVGLFTADCRDLEFFFTKGMIPEEQYRTRLERIARKYHVKINGEVQ